MQLSADTCSGGVAQIVRLKYGINTTVRQEMGQDIAGACGQLVVDSQLSRAAGDAAQPLRQAWTTRQHDGTNRLGLWDNQVARLSRPGSGRAAVGWWTSKTCKV